jgi:hypothetical protein
MSREVIGDWGKELFKEGVVADIIGRENGSKRGQ